MNIVAISWVKYFVAQVFVTGSIAINTLAGNIQLKTEEGTAEYEDSRQDIVGTIKRIFA